MRAIAYAIMPLLEKLYYDRHAVITGAATVGKNALYVRVDEDRGIAYLHFQGEETPSMSVEIESGLLFELERVEFDLIVRPTCKDGYRAVAISQSDEDDMELVLLVDSRFEESPYLVPNKVKFPYDKQDTEIVEVLSKRINEGVYTGQAKKNAFMFRQVICTQLHCNKRISNKMFQAFMSGKFVNGHHQIYTYSHAAVTILNHHIVALGYKRLHLGKELKPWFLVDGKHPIEWYPLSLLKTPNEEQKKLILKHLGEKLISRNEETGKL